MPINDTTAHTNGTAEILQGDVSPSELVDPNTKFPNSADDITPIVPRHAGPNLWTVTQKWILALPTGTEKERLRRKQLQKELEWIVSQLDDGQGLGEEGVGGLLLCVRCSC